MQKAAVARWGPPSERVSVLQIVYGRALHELVDVGFYSVRLLRRV
jgi:hypothetical protein